MQLKDFGNPTYIVLETFRENGEGVKTPVWVAAEGNKLYVWTVDNSGKVKRIRNNGRVRVAVSDARGNLKSDWVEAQARAWLAPRHPARPQLGGASLARLPRTQAGQKVACPTNSAMASAVTSR